MTTTITEKTYSTGFKDLDLSLQIHPVKKDVNTHKNEYAIINSIKNLILTNHYEKFFHPEIGSNIRRLLFIISSCSVCVCNPFLMFSPCFLSANTWNSILFSKLDFASSRLPPMPPLSLSAPKQHTRFY